MELEDPRGKIAWWERWNVEARGGMSRLDMPLVRDAVPGGWNLRARDVASGAGRVRKLAVRPGGEKHPFVKRTD